MNEVEKGILSTDENPPLYCPCLGGMKVFQNAMLPRTKETLIPRTWKERLFTRPWKPFMKTRKVEEPLIVKMIVPYDYYMFTVDTTKGEEVLVMHPEVYLWLKKEFKKENN